MLLKRLGDFAVLRRMLRHMVDSRAIALAAAVLAAACGDDAAEAPAPPPRPPGETAGSAVPGGSPVVGGGAVRFSVEDVTVAEAVRTLAEATGTTVVIDPDAQVVADCARITVATARPLPPEELYEVVQIGLRPASITLERTPRAVVLRREADAPLPASCRDEEPLRPSFAQREEVDPEVRERRWAALEEGIRRRSDTEYLITEEAGAALMEPNAMMRSARIVPHMENGEVVGLEVYGIRRSSPLGMLGIQNGDQIRTVNGYDMSSPESALEAYARLRGQDRYTVQLVRRGQPVEITYRVVGRLP